MTKQLIKMKTLKRIYFTVVLNWQFLIAVIFSSVIRVYGLMCFL